MIGATTGSIAALPFLVSFLGGRTETKILHWLMPDGMLVFQIDSISTLFLLPLFLLTFVVSVFGYQYLKNDHKHPGVLWFSFNILIVSMITVLLARNGIMFLFAWEIMSLSSLLLVLHEHEKKDVVRAGWIYFAATHTGTAFLIVLFLLLAQLGGSFNFGDIPLHSITGQSGIILFILMVIGFGCKAGLVPFHIWLPEAHPAAPSHVSALMSGVMIKMGIYGILRMLTFLGKPDLFCGISLLTIGLITAIFGILFALSQKDIKRLLAYSSVENIGIITIGIGIGLVGIHYSLPYLIVGGFTGALLHIINHTFLKGILFLSAGAVYHATGTRNMERLGGLNKTMPFITGFVLLGSLAISGLPPLNGFISEFFIYFAAVKSIMNPLQVTDNVGVAVMFVLACVGGLAVVCFCRFFGIVFLGEQRDSSVKVEKVNWVMNVSIGVLVVLCILISVGSAYLLPLLQGPLVSISGVGAEEISPVLTDFKKSIFSIMILSVSFAGLSAVFFIIINRMLKRRSVKYSVTWDCGYAEPTARMQYTGTSFTQPLVKFFSKVIRPEMQKKIFDQYFPQSGSVNVNFHDVFIRYLYRPFFRVLITTFSRLRWLQGGKIHIYIMYITIAVLAALAATFSM